MAYCKDCRIEIHGEAKKCPVCGEYLVYHKDEVDWENTENRPSTFNCQICNKTNKTNSLIFASLSKHTGLILARRTETYESWMCGDCLKYLYKECLKHCLIAGWWSPFSLFINPAIIIWNTYTYFASLHILKKPSP